jgi:hypothetical protein
LNVEDEKLISYLVEQPLDVNFKPEHVDEDPLDQLEKFQAKIKNENDVEQLALFMNAHAEMPLKRYIRRWSNWVVDLHWLFTLQYFMESLPSAKLYYFIKNYPILDNFILHWMWWSYSLNKDIEIFTKDSFRAVGTMPWLVNDINLSEESLTKVEVSVNKKKKKKSTSVKRKKNTEGQKLKKRKASTEDHVSMSNKIDANVRAKNENLKKFDQLITVENKPNKTYKKNKRSNSTNEALPFESNKYGKQYLLVDFILGSLIFLLVWGNCKV